MEKMLVSGMSDGFSKMVIAELRNSYEIIECEFSESELRRTIRMQKPRLFLSFKSEATFATVYADFRDKFANTGIVVICDEPVVALQKLFIPGLMVAVRPVSIEFIKKALSEVWMETAEVAPQKSILAVDDNAMILRNIKEMLGGRYDVAVATSGRKAFEMLEKNSYNLILLDYEMPVMSGLEVFKKMRKNPDYSDIPVVFLTGVAERTKIMEVVELKPDGYLLKPIDSAALNQVIEDVMG